MKDIKKQQESIIVNVVEYLIGWGNPYPLKFITKMVITQIIALTILFCFVPIVIVKQIIIEEELD